MKKFFIFLEIPEFEGFFLDEKIKAMRLYGLDSEKPLLRLNNFLFEGKWIFFLYNPILFSRHIENKKMNKKKFISNVFIKKYFKIDKHRFSVEKKILRFYRIPLLIKVVN